MTENDLQNITHKTKDREIDFTYNKLYHLVSVKYILLFHRKYCICETKNFDFTYTWCPYKLEQLPYICKEC
jgi:hypothetical protein